ncbi:MAG: hypothetical protein HC825_07035 [Oscillatoriales cyanobacterium RM1_1_9]|nr:hypothetical protein [Oscillatoriales cyanobacterium RM1_1_9]
MRVLYSGIIVSVCSNLLSLPVVGIQTTARSASHTPTPSPSWIAQTPPSNSPSLGQQLIQEISQCMAGAFSGTEPGTPQEFQAASMRCTIQTIILDPQGNIRADASDRMGAMLAFTGAAVPQTISQGEATIQLQQLPDSQVFTVPVTIAGNSQRFLLDTGASNSILSQQTIQQLGLLGMPIPSDLLAYFVVGDDCSQVQASIHRLPPVSVEAANVEGMSGMGLSQLPANAQGVLGMDFLKGFDLVLDPKALSLKLLPPSPTVNGAIPLQGKLGVMIVEVYVNGQGPFPFLVDTGADLMVISQRLADRLAIDRAQNRGFSSSGILW